MLQNINPPVFTGDLRDNTFEQTQDLLEAVFNGEAGAIGRLYKEQRHRVFHEVQNQLTGRVPNLRAFVFPGTDGLCCMVTYEVVNGKVLVTCNRGLDLIAISSAPRTSILYYFYENQPVLTIDPEDGGCFADPRLLKPQEADDVFASALAKLGTSPERVMAGNPPRPQALRRSQFNSQLAAGRR